MGRPSTGSSVRQAGYTVACAAAVVEFDYSFRPLCADAALLSLSVPLFFSPMNRFASFEEKTGGRHVSDTCSLSVSRAVIPVSLHGFTVL